MAESSDWKIKGEIVSIEKIAKELFTDLAFISNGIGSGHIECRKGTNSKGQQFTQVLRGQVERFINSDPVGALHLARMRQQNELSKINRDITTFKKYLAESQEKKLELEIWLAANPMPR